MKNYLLILVALVGISSSSYAKPIERRDSFTDKSSAVIGLTGQAVVFLFGPPLHVYDSTASPRHCIVTCLSDYDALAIYGPNHFGIYGVSAQFFSFRSGKSVGYSAVFSGTTVTGVPNSHPSLPFFLKNGYLPKDFMKKATRVSSEGGKVVLSYTRGRLAWDVATVRDFTRPIVVQYQIRLLSTSETNANGVQETDAFVPATKLKCDHSTWRPFLAAVTAYCQAPNDEGQLEAIKRYRARDCKEVLTMMKTCKNGIGAVNPIRVNAQRSRAGVDLGVLYGYGFTVWFSRADALWRVDALGRTANPNEAVCGTDEYKPFSAAIGTYCATSKKQPKGFCPAVLPALRSCIYRGDWLSRMGNAIILLSTPFGQSVNEPYVSFDIEGSSEGHGREKFWSVTFRKCQGTWTVKQVEIAVPPTDEGSACSTEAEYPGPVQCPESAAKATQETGAQDSAIRATGQARASNATGKSAAEQVGKELRERDAARLACEKQVGKMWYAARCWPTDVGKKMKERDDVSLRRQETCEKQKGMVWYGGKDTERCWREADARADCEAQKGMMWYGKQCFPEALE